jgi:VWFA-related protein
MPKTRAAIPVCLIVFGLAAAWLAFGQQERVMPGTPAKPGIAPPKAGVISAPPKPPAPNPAQSADDTPIIRATVNVVLVPTTVTDKKGKTINGLQPQDFVLYDNDKLQEINRDVAFLPLSMVICIQRSWNVDAVLPKIRKTGNIIRDLLVGQDGEVAIMGFDHRVELLQDFTSDADLIDAAIEKLKPGSQSDRLNDAIQSATRLLRHKRDRRKVILLISETMDRGSEAKVKEVATELQMFNVDVFTLNISRIVTRLTEKPAYPRSTPFPAATQPRAGPGPQTPTTVAQNTAAPGYGADFIPVIEEIFTATKAIFVSNPAEVYTKFTGGRERSFITQADLEGALTDIGGELRSQYLLSYSPNNKIEGGFHKIRVDVNRPTLKVRTRPGYWMAAIPD